jgi:hypothetical protein
VFRRRRREDAEPGYDSDTAQDDPELYGDPDELGELDEQDEDEGHGSKEAASGPAGQWDQRSGPWDGASGYPERDRIDFGSLLVPLYEGIEVEVKVADGVGVWITVRRGDSAIELMAFAAPKTSGLWEEVRQEFAEEVRKSGGESQEARGPFGVELQAQVPASSETARRGALEPVRFLGVDGSRWFLRGMIRGPAARRQDLAQPFEDLFADVVVVRGDHPAPPGDLLEIRLPDDMRQALAAQMEQENAGPDFLNPFDRGPEITETR